MHLSAKIVTTLLKIVYKKIFSLLKLSINRLKIPQFLDNWHINVVRMSALLSVCLYSRELSQILISVTRWVGAKAIVWQEGLCQ
jgi:hypothetical protein